MSLYKLTYDGKINKHQSEAKGRRRPTSLSESAPWKDVGEWVRRGPRLGWLANCAGVSPCFVYKGELSQVSWCYKGLMSIPADHRRIYEVDAFVESIKLIRGLILNDKQTAAGSGLVFWEYEKIWSRLSLWGIRVMEDQSGRRARSQSRVYLRLNSLLPAPAATSIYEFFPTDSLAGYGFK